MTDFKEQNVSSSQKISMSNALVRAAHGLSLQEKRLLMLAVSKLDSRKPATPENMVVQVNVTEFASEYGIKSKTLYSEAKAATEQLMNRYIRFKHGRSETRMQWVGRSTYKEGEGLIEIAFWHELSPMLFELEKQFTSYKLSRTGGLRSKYAWRLFELLMQFKKTGYLRIDIDDFHHAMDTTKSMRSKFTNLTARVIEPAAKEIKEKDGLKIAWRPIKTGRKVTSLEFTFPPETQTELPNMDTVISMIDDALVNRYVSDNPELTRGKTYKQIIKQLREVYPKAKVTSTY